MKIHPSKLNRNRSIARRAFTLIELLLVLTILGILAAIVIPKLSGRTETLTIFVEQQFLGFDLTGAYTASLVLAGIALLVLFAMQRLKPREGV